MLILNSTGSLVKLVTTTTGDIDVHSSFVDWDSANPTTPIPSMTNFSPINSATTTTIVGAPTGVLKRNVKAITIRNSHTTGSQALTVQHSDGSLIADIFGCTIAAGETIALRDGVWFVYDVNGGVKSSASASTVRTIKLTADASAWTTTTVADTGLSFSVLNGHYYHFKFQCMHRAAATTTGIKLTVTFPAATQFACAVDTPVSTAAGGTANITRDWITTSGDVVIGTGTPSATENFLALVEGIIVPSADGTVMLQGASEVAASNVTLKQGSFGICTEIL